MFRKILQGLIGLLGISLGYMIAELLLQGNILNISNQIIKYGIFGLIALIVGGVFYLLAPWIMKKVENLVIRLEKKIQNESKDDLVIGFFGVILGIIFAFLISLPLNLLRLPEILSVFMTILTIIAYVICVSLGYRLAMKSRDDIKKNFAFFKKRSQREKSENSKEVKESEEQRGNVSYKLLDTSVIIDGRIKQIAKTGFLEGTIIIPQFVLEELQYIADSHDEVKRERGRRGLDMVNELKQIKHIDVQISDKDYIETKEVDIKLLKFAQETEASIITNDFNLNKLAHVQGIKVLNINDLANSVKTVVIPGEKMIVQIIKEGREKQQGLAYLEDGTMIVVEDAKHLIGETLEVEVTTVLQTAAGKMIFTKIN